MTVQTGDLVTRAKTRFGDPDNRILQDTDWIAYLNDGYREVNGRHRDWPWHRQFSSYLVITSAGTNGYAVNGTSNAEVYSVDSVWCIETNQRLYPVETGTSRFLDSWGQPDLNGAAESGPPMQYRMLGGQLYLYPQPDAVYHITVEGPASTPDLSLGVHPQWPARYGYALVEFALSRAYQDDGNMDWAKSHREVGESMVAAMENDLLAQPLHESYPGVVDDWYA